MEQTCCQEWVILSQHHLYFKEIWGKMYLLKRYSEQCFISDCSLQEALFIYYYNTKKLSVTPDDTLSNLKCDSIETRC